MVKVDNNIGVVRVGVGPVIQKLQYGIRAHGCGLVQANEFVRKPMSLSPSGRKQV